MNNDIKKIYNMLYSPIITPYNLLENSKLENYSYVKYYKNNNGLIAEMECNIPDEGLKIFYYHFDQDNYLQQVYMEDKFLTKLVFDRNNELEKAKNEYHNTKMLNENAV